MTSPLAGLRVLDFTSLLPGPLATLVLAEAGASVVKVERPLTGEPGRRGNKPGAPEAVEFALLNKGKKSIQIDLKGDRGRAKAISLASRADVLVEQFRPGVMERLGLGYADLAARNPRLIYCSITGYGQTGTMAQTAGHDLNYIARSGMLALSTSDGVPVFPQGHYADIGGGTYPALLNILLAVLDRERTGRGRHLDIAMAENTFFWMRRALAPILNGTPPPRDEPLASSSHVARYGIYRAADGVSLAVAPLEEPFWQRFCDLIDLSMEDRDPGNDPARVRELIRSKIAGRTASEWQSIFADEDVCVEVARDVRDVVDDPHFIARGVFDRRLALHSGREIPALPLPLDGSFVSRDPGSYPALGESDGQVETLWSDDSAPDGP